jgi:hypothetical protein
MAITVAWMGGKSVMRTIGRSQGAAKRARMNRRF